MNGNLCQIALGTLVLLSSSAYADWTGTAAHRQNVDQIYTIIVIDKPAQVPSTKFLPGAYFQEGFYNYTSDESANAEVRKLALEKCEKYRDALQSQFSQIDPSLSISVRMGEKQTLGVFPLRTIKRESLCLLDFSVTKGQFVESAKLFKGRKSEKDCKDELGVAQNAPETIGSECRDVSSFFRSKTMLEVMSLKTN